MPNMDDRRWALEQALKTMDQHRNLIEVTRFKDLVGLVLTTAESYSSGLDKNYQTNISTPEQ